MLESVRFTKGLGNEAVYARILDGATFWNFVTLVWVEVETAQCRAFLAELTDSSVDSSWYQAAITPPDGGPFAIEVVYDGGVIGYDLTPAAAGHSTVPRTGLTGKQILDDVFATVQGGGAAVRAKALVWLNVAASKLPAVRPWLFLNTRATLTPVNNIIAVPSGFGEFQELTTSNYRLNTSHRLTEGEAWHIDRAISAYAFPQGFTERTGQIVLHGGVGNDPVTLFYAIEPPPITDDETATVWPSKCRAFFLRCLLDFFYEFDMDERRAMSYQIQNQELLDLKKWDNSLKPKTQPNRHGYRRTR